VGQDVAGLKHGSKGRFDHLGCFLRNVRRTKDVLQVDALGLVNRHTAACIAKSAILPLMSAMTRTSYSSWMRVTAFSTGV
jgi:hypothetical protein